ncbi:MAG: hypothetical protein HPY58_11815 [Firmicutes bacterium]|nr:hypothetical protein [Bacillota bacterium]NPV30306.1 hypothetical protein [Bacillota bacterium]
MSRCLKCGLFSTLNSECFWFKKKFSRQDLAASGECPYFTEILYEDGVPLTPYQHFLLKKQDLESKKMQGPV